VSGVVNPGQSRDESGAPRPIAALLARLPLEELVVERPEEVARYLERHPDLSGTVQRVTWAAARRLGGRAQLSLELHRDPEIREKLLTLYVRQAAYDDDLLAVLDQIAEEQGVDPSTSSGWFQFTTDFQPPR
jgi:hypothetical protein